MLTLVPGCELEVQRGPDWLVVRIRNLDFEAQRAVSLADEIWELMERHLAHRLVLELDCVPGLSRRLMAELTGLYRRICEHDGVMRICGLSAENCRLLHAFGLDDRLLPYANWEEAVWGCNGPPKPR